MTSYKNTDSNILVVGDLMIDHYLWGACERISPEAPVQVVDIEKETTVLGGAGNVINNLKALGANVSVSSVIGDDAIGEELKKMLEGINVDCSNIIVQEGRKTSKKSRVIASSQQVIRYDKESKENIEDSSVSKILDALVENIKKYDVIILSDYGKGVLRTALSQGIIALANNHNIKVLVDPKGSDFSKYKGSYLLTPNKKEAVLATGIDIK
ncbi:MAG: bifunctional heptose 7-phosphate kinase/heptose 1-phosphate adenyltransferase, partial [Helicobacteraceae bacterium]|nr:bifunctional heptose 7-phosphate kinase/heptose 1-phosphate adenyltransferase [Candidatus Sulfurimonas ponti]MBL6973895.1 bifunctional heptose 7-phosphate kinase/heptose 1-phosphate adenyltransferase [Sulfurimonas sp.]